MLRTKTSRIATAIASLAAFTLWGITPAQAATCTYNGCNGKDPQAAGCASGATTWHEWTEPYKWGKVRVELRHSASCHSVWVRTTSTWCDEGPYHYHEPATLGGPVMETGYIDYYGTYHRQGLFNGPKSPVNCGQAPVDWTPMSSDRRERIRHSYLGLTGVTYLTGCNDCY
jgi:hypothetical protein